MLRIKRAVQAAYNTETSFIAAQAAAAQKGTTKPTETSGEEARDAADPMAAMEREMGGGAGANSTSTTKKGGPAFVASTLRTTIGGLGQEDGVDNGDEGEIVNPDAIAMDEDEF